MAAPRPHISVHALLRWLERAEGLDLAAAQERMLTARRAQAIRDGARAIRCREEDVTLVVAADGTITTVLPGAKAVVHSKPKETGW